MEAAATAQKTGQPQTKDGLVEYRKRRKAEKGTKFRDTAGDEWKKQELEERTCVEWDLSKKTTFNRNDKRQNKHQRDTPSNRRLCQAKTRTSGPSLARPRLVVEAWTGRDRGRESGGVIGGTLPARVNQSAGRGRPWDKAERAPVRAHRKCHKRWRRPLYWGTRTAHLPPPHRSGSSPSHLSPSAGQRREGKLRE